LSLDLELTSFERADRQRHGHEPYRAIHGPLLRAARMRRERVDRPRGRI
jgi:hypothetical protein